MVSWRKIRDRIDDLTLRERGLVFSSIVLIMVALPYSLVVAPSLARQKTLLERIRQDQSQIDSVRKELQAIITAQSQDISAEDRKKLDGLENNLAAIEVRLREKQSMLVPAGKVPDLIRGVLSRSSRLQLISVSALPGIPMLGAASGAAQPAAAGKSAAAPSGSPTVSPEAQLYKRGVEITVKGAYLDLLQFLADLEKSPWRLLWGSVTLDAENYPTVTMKATVFTLSRDRSAAAF